MDQTQIESVSVGTANRKVITKIMISTLGVTRFKTNRSQLQLLLVLIVAYVVAMLQYHNL